MDSAAGQATQAIVQFDLNGPDAERVVKSIMHRVGSGFGVKLSVTNARILSQVLYHQAMKIQVLEGSLTHARKQNEQARADVVEAKRRWYYWR